MRSGDLFGRGAAEPVAAAWLRWARPASLPSAKPSTISSFPPPFILTLRRPERADQEGYCCLCDGGGQGAVAHLNGGYWRGLSDRVAVLLLIKCAFFLL